MLHMALDELHVEPNLTPNGEKPYGFPPQRPLVDLERARPNDFPLCVPDRIARRSEIRALRYSSTDHSRHHEQHPFAWGGEVFDRPKSGAGQNDPSTSATGSLF